MADFRDPNNDIEARVPMIQDALESVSAHYPQHEFFFYPFADLVLLFYQRPCYLTVWREGGNHPQLLFTSLAPCDETRYNIDPVRSLEKRETNHMISIEDNDEGNIRLAVSPRGQVIISEDELGLRQVIDSNEIKVRICQAARVSYARNSNAKVAPAPSNWMDLLGPLQKRLDFSYGGYTGSSLFQDEPNLWCAVRHQGVEGAIREAGQYQFTYTASLLPTLAQEKRILDELGSSDALQVFRQPLGLKSRAIADSPFGSGCLDHGFPDERDSSLSRDVSESGYDSADGKRKRLEDRLYTAVHKTYRENRETTVIMYVPVHVTGTPWLALYSFWPEQSWMERYRLYRDLIPLIAGQLRSAAQEAYIECVSAVLEDTAMRCADWFSLPAVANPLLEEVTKVYPFEAIKLHARIQDEAKADWPGSRQVLGYVPSFDFGLERNEYFKKHYDGLYNLEEKRVKERCSNVLFRVNAVRMRQVFQTYNVAHSLKGRLGSLRKQVSDHAGIIQPVYRAVREGKKKAEDILPELTRGATDAYNLMRLADQIYSFASIAHLLHCLIQEGPDRTLDLTTKEGVLRFADEGPLDLGQMLLKNVDSIIPWDSPDPNRRIELHMYISRLEVYPFHRRYDEKPMVRPFNDFYCESLYEVLGNALKHGDADKDHRVHVAIHGDSADQQESICFTNYRVMADAKKHSALEPSEYIPSRDSLLGTKDPMNWKRWAGQGPSGLAFVTQTLDGLQAGRLLYCESGPDRNNRVLFTSRLVLRGLKWEE